jgi:hypothetical protein
LLVVAFLLELADPPHRFAVSLGSISSRIMRKRATAPSASSSAPGEEVRPHRHRHAVLGRFA